MSRLSRIFVSTSVAATLTYGCAPLDDGDEDTKSSVAVDALSSRPVTTAECQSFEAQHPSGATVHLATGVDVGTNFRACDANIGAIVGTVDLSFAESMLVGTDQVPLTVVQNGKPPTGLAQFFLGQTLDTDLGPYTEFMVLIQTVDQNAPSDVKTLNWVNPFSSLLPYFDPKTRTFIPLIILDKNAKTPIAYGREVIDLDKRGGAVDIVHDDGEMSFSVKDDTGAGVLRGAIRPDKSVLALLLGMGNLGVAAIGDLMAPNDIHLKLHPLTLDHPIEASLITYWQRLSNPAEMAGMTSTFWWLPSMNAATPTNLDLEFDRSSEWGRRLEDAHFTPVTIVSADHATYLVVPL
jgi:hypothetical protein